MKLKIIKIIVALVLPIILGVLLYQAKTAQGPFHIWHHSDPSYVYLFNSINLNYGYVPGHIDHPGTILQYLGVIIIKITYWVSGTKTTIIEDVVAQPEKYLSILSNVIIVFNVLAFFVIALLADRYLKRIWIGIYLQLIPLFFIDISVFYIYKIMAESMLWVFATYLAFLCIIFWFKKPEVTNQNKCIFAFSLVVALGIITKFTFMPFAIIPLFLIQNNRKKGYYILITVLLFILIALPALFSYKYIFDWISSLLIHSGHYGTGKVDVILNANAFLSSLETIITSYLLFPIIIVVISGLIWLLKYKEFNHRNALLNKKILLFFLFFFLMVIVNSLLVAKHYDPRYLTIIICFSFGILPVFYLFLQEIFKDKLGIQKIINSLCIIMIVGMLYGTHTFNDGIVMLEQNKQKRTELNDKILKAKEEKTIVIYYYANSSPMFALAFGISFGGIMKDTYAYYTQKLNPDMIELNITNNKCYVWSKPIPISKIIEQKKRIFLQGSILPENYKNTIKILNDDDTKELSFPVKLIFDNQSGECIYELIY